MSSRRAVGEDNILAMLERDSARRSGVRVSTVRLAWYGAAAAFAGILAGGVAWLAYDNHRTAGELQAMHEAGATPQPSFPAPQAPAVEPSRAAVIVDESPPTRVASALPPLVMLPPQEGGTKRVPAGPPPGAARSSTVAPLVMLPPKDAAASRPAPKPAARSAKEATGVAMPKARKAQSATRSGSGKKADSAQRSTTRPAKAAQQRSAAQPLPEAARLRKSARGAPQVDSDVALISAIIAQSERHRGEREGAAACSGANCPARPAHP